MISIEYNSELFNHVLKIKKSWEDENIPNGLGHLAYKL